MSRIAIVSLTLSAGDAVGHDGLHMRQVLAGWGHEVELFSCHWVRKTAHTRDMAEAADFLGEDPKTVLIYQHATGWAAGVDLLCRARCRRVVRYHNVTPARFFAGYPGDYVRACQTGRDQLIDLARAGCDLYLSDSPYNQGELLEAGADPARCAVVPPFHPIDRLCDVPPDPETLRRFGDGQTNLLFVGRLAPNKGHRFLIDAFAVYQEHLDQSSRLILIGKEERPLAAYTNQLREQATRLGVRERVLFLEGVTEGELRACYESASAFLVASEHEGFCVPVVEALALGVPVVAYATTAVPDTLGQAGLAWPEPDPYLLAQSAARVAKDGGLRRRLAEAGRRRYREHFATGRLERAFADALRPLLHVA